MKTNKDVGTPKKKRRPHTRVAKACEYCRRQKTRCLRTEGTVSCLRCISLKLPCSLESSENAEEIDADKIALVGHAEVQMDKISDDVKSILNLLKRSGRGMKEVDVRFNFTDSGDASLKQAPMTMVARTSHSLNGDQVQYEASLPNTVFHQLGMPGFLQMPSPPQFTDIIDEGLLSQENALQLLTIFRDRYGRWISWPDTATTQELFLKAEVQCPLLLTVACALALNYSDPHLKDELYGKLLAIIKEDLELNMTNPPLVLEYLQAIVLLSGYGTTLSSSSSAGYICFDNLDMSSHAIHVLLQMNRFGLGNRLYTREHVDPDFNQQTVYRLWNTLVMTQLVYSILYGRRSTYNLQMLRPKDPEILSSATNFDTRLFAETLVMNSAYSYILLDDNLANTKSDLAEWHQRYSRIFGEPFTQFVEIDYNWVELLVLVKSAGPHMSKEELNVCSMRCLHCLELINSIDDDSYFAFLSDQIHLIIFYCCNQLIEYVSQGVDLDRGDAFDQLVHHIDRLENVSASPDDAFIKYATLLRQNLTHKFADVPLQEDSTLSTPR